MNIDFLKERMLLNKDKVAVVSDDVEYTFSKLYDEYLNAKVFLEENNIHKSNIVLINADYNARSIAMMIALIELDTVIVPISLSSKSLDKFIRISQAEYVIKIDDDIKINKIEVIVDNPLLADFLKKENSGLILFSSGSTGEPKGILHDLRFLIEKYKKTGKTLKTISFLLFDHIGGFNTMMYSLSNGNMIVTLKDRSPEEICKAIEKYKVELLPTSPTFINLLILSGVYERYDLSSLKIISYGTEPMPELTLKKLHDIFPDIKLKQTYGLSEVGILSTKSLNSDSLWIKLGGDDFKVKIVDDILYIKSQTSMIGYLNAPFPFDEDGWFNTNDKVEQNGTGYIKILGRKSELIVIGGEKVYPSEIENVLISMDGINDASVFSQPNSITGKAIVAVVSVDKENNNREFIKKIRTFCKNNLESFKRPSTIKLTEDNLYNERFKKKRMF